MAIGGAATYGALTQGVGGETSNKSSPKPSFHVGIGCDKKPGSILTTHEGDAFTFRCLKPDGSPGKVTALSNLIRRQYIDPIDYSAIVNVTSPDIIDRGAVIDFDFKGNDGLAVIGVKQAVAPAVNLDDSNEIARNTNTADTQVWLNK